MILLNSDILIFATPPQNKFKLITDVCKKIDSRFLIIEKPLSDKLNDAKLIHQFLKKNNKKAFVSYQRNWDKKTSLFLNKIEKKKNRLYKCNLQQRFLK